MAEASPENLLQAAIEISAAAAAIPLRYFRTGLAVEDKPDESPVTLADRETEAEITRAIHERFPTHGIFGEEFGRQSGTGAYTWIIDPIDGTKSFISGSPLFGMLLGVIREGRAEAGLIRMPALGECIAGYRGGGATLNGNPICCRPAAALGEARIFLNEANLLMEREPARFARLCAAGKLRRFANDCYSFALLAMGQIDAVVDFDLKPYDYMPVVPVIETAGGVITDWQGRPLGLGSDGTVLAAGSAALHGELLELLAHKARLCGRKYFFARRRKGAREKTRSQAALLVEIARNPEPACTSTPVSSPPPSRPSRKRKPGLPATTAPPAR
jgi:histidinol phosphatase-like enzyme (inositol monophosphatase family)